MSDRGDSTRTASPVRAGSQAQAHPRPATLAVGRRGAVLHAADVRWGARGRGRRGGVAGEARGGRAGGVPEQAWHRGMASRLTVTAPSVVT